MEKNVLETSSTIANQTDNNQSGKIIERDQIPNTPFTLVTEMGEGHFLAIGNYRITEKTRNLDELLQKIETRDWNLLINTIIAITNIK